MKSSQQVKNIYPAVLYRLTHETSTTNYAAGAFEGGYFFTIVGNLGRTSPHDCPAKRGYGETAGCTFEDGANIGKLVKMKVENIVGNTWIFSVLFVAIDGELTDIIIQYSR